MAASVLVDLALADPADPVVVSALAALAVPVALVRAGLAGLEVEVVVGTWPME